MNKVIKDYAKFDDELQDEIYVAYSDGELERATFPFKGKIEDGVLFVWEDTTYLIPKSTISSRRAGGSDDDDDDDDDRDDDDIIGDDDIDDAENDDMDEE
jgi:hypothetical protein